MALRPFLILAALIAPSVVGAADTATRDNNLGGQMLGICRMGAMTSTAAQNATFTQNANGGVLAFTTLADPQTAIVRDASLTIALEGMCNQPHVLRLRSTNGGLVVDTPTTAAGFVDRIDYIARVAWAGETANLQPQGQAGATLMLPVSAPAASGLNLQIDLVPENRPAVAGEYEDSLVVELFGNL